MLSAEDIIVLEKKWLKYKIKEKSKVFFFTLLTIILATSIYMYKSVYIGEKTSPTSQVLPSVNLSKLAEKEKAQEKNVKSYEAILPQKVEQNLSVQPIVSVHENNTTKLSNIEVKQSIEKNKKVLQIQQNELKWHLKILPELKGNDLFTTTTAEIKFNRPITEEKKTKTPPERVNSKPEKDTIVNKIEQENEKKLDIDISSNEIDTIKYLQNKFYATENVVFAIMLSEELYNTKNFNESIKWALTANEIDSKNDKSWYWFAKNKVKLGQKDDAIKAIEAFLSTNNSRRLSDLLKNIKYGEMND